MANSTLMPRIKRCEKLVDKLLTKVTDNAKGWDIFDAPKYSNGKTTGTTVLLRSLGGMKDIS